MRELQNKKRDFKGIWIPAEIWLNTDLTLIEKIVFVEIDSLDGEDGCYANNQHFADFCDISKGRASQIINSLRDKGYVSVDITRDSRGQVTKRTIRSLMTYSKKTLSSKTIEGVSQETKGGSIENDEYKNTSLKNTLSKEDIYSQAEARREIPYKEIMEYLNEKTGRNFNYKAAGNRKFIKARANEGYTLDDFKKVIDIKVAEWKGTEWEAYLRPKTLFSGNFDNYLNQEVEIKTEKKEKQLGGKYAYLQQY